MTTPDEKLPIYRPVFDELTDLTFVSLVDDPAIGVRGIALSKEEQKEFVKIELKFDDYKQIITGPVLIPDILIYRNDPVLGEFNLQFSKEDIQGLFDIYNQKISSDKINVDHSFISKSGYPQGNWIIEFKEDKSKGYGYDLPIGTWFMETKIKDKEEFIKLKESGMNSFSIEGVFNLMKVALKNNNIKMENNEIKTEEVIDTVLEVTPEVEPINEVKKLEITPEDIAMIWEAIKPMVAEMLAAEKVEEVPNGEEEMKALESKLSKQISDLEATIKSTPAAESITLSKVSNDPRNNEFEAKLEAIRKLAKL